MTTPFTVYSYGGSGSKYLVSGLSRAFAWRDVARVHSHERAPTADTLAERGHALFVFADPVDAVVSFFARRLSRTAQHGFTPSEGTGDPTWAQRHCENIGGRHERLSTDWVLSDFLEAGDDLFDLAPFVEHWLALHVAQPVLFLRYESLWQQRQVVADFMGLDDRFVEQFGPELPRRSRATDLPPAQQARAQALYGPLQRRLQALPAAFVLKEGKTQPITPSWRSAA